jgi:hypothetical protein
MFGPSTLLEVAENNNLSGLIGLCSVSLFDGGLELFRERSAAAWNRGMHKNYSKGSSLFLALSGKYGWQKRKSNNKIFDDYLDRHFDITISGRIL